LGNQGSGSNFGVGYFGKKIVFASTKNMESPEYNWNKKSYLDLYEATVSEGDDKQLDSIVAFSKNINIKDQHESSAVFTKDGKTMFFSRNQKKRVAIDSNKVAVVSIFKAQLVNNEWQAIEPVSFSSDSYSTMHPALNSEEDKLYFSSDMPNSLGAFDIYYVDIAADGSFGTPVNLGAAINTAHREQFPFIAKDSTLYFASNGKQGLGGLDIFSSKYEENSYLEALNLGEIINSETDDFAFVVLDALDTGYMSSNRGGIDQIYSFERTPADRQYFVEGLVTDKRTGELLPNTVVTLFDNYGDIITEITVGEDGKYKLEVKPNQSYQLEGFQPKYIPETKYFDTNDRGNIEFNIELGIESYNDAEEIVNDREDGNTYIELENIYFDFAKWDIKPQAAKTLDILVNLLKKYPRMEIQLGAHTDSRSSFEFNMDLSEKRAAATLEYLVENGIPRKRLRSKGYGETKPLVNCGDDCTETEFSINRRCEFLILR
jgi:outer membrane protein OmpA-like peptidoglycan-associated protein